LHLILSIIIIVIIIIIITTTTFIILMAVNLLVDTCQTVQKIMKCRIQ